MIIVVNVLDDAAVIYEDRTWSFNYQQQFDDTPSPELF